MSNRDYANRKPRAARAKSPRATKGKPQGRTMGQIPIIPTLLVFLLVGGFAYFLWSIKDSAKEVTPTAEAVKATTKPAKKDPHALPPKPQEEWTYLEELENKNVEVDVPEPSNKPSQPYQMQCGSFRKESQANEMKARIAFQGLEANVRKVEGNSGVWYKVVLGPYKHKREGERQRHKLQNSGLNGCQIWLWEG